MKVVRSRGCRSTTTRMIRRVLCRDFSAPLQIRVTQRTRSVLMSESIGSEAVMPAINAHLAAELLVEGERMPVFVWTIDHPAGRALVDTGMIERPR
jgi:hypothetical protein